MESIGTAQLVQVRNSSGVTVKAWDLRPFGGVPLELGLPSTPLPPEGTTVDRTLPNGRILRIEASKGDVFEVQKGVDPPPTVGPTGGPTATGAGLLRSPMILAALAGAAWFFLRRKRR